jgi:hypothetical protein
MIHYIKKASRIHEKLFIYWEFIAYNVYIKCENEGKNMVKKKGLF